MWEYYIIEISCEIISEIFLFIFFVYFHFKVASVEIQQSAESELTVSQLTVSEARRAGGVLFLEMDWAYKDLVSFLLQH